MSKVLALLSGGMDSTTLVAKLRGDSHSVETVSINYGQRHVKEMEAAERVADHYDLHHMTVDLSTLREHLSGSSLTDDSVPVPDGHYAEQSMRATVVPNRNLIMLSVAAGIAVARGLDAVATAVHGGDHFIYPDCRPGFIGAAGAAIFLGTDTFAANGRGVDLMAPFLWYDKATIAALGNQLDAPLHLSWSCYKGGTVHCGTCGTCVERHEAFEVAGVFDPTVYDES